MPYEKFKELISSKFDEKIIFNIIKTKKDLTDIKVEKIEIGGDSKKGDAYLSKICKFTLEATGKNARGEQEKLFIPIIVKSLLANIARRKTFRSPEFFENEAIFYEKVWSAMDKFQKSKNVSEPFTSIPLLLSAYVDGNNDYIAFEDLSYEGFGSAQRGTGLDETHALLILKLFAEFHGLALAFKDQEPQAFEKAANQLKETYFSEAQRGWYEKFQGVLWVIARDAISKELPPNYTKKWDGFVAGDIFGRICDLCTVRGPLSVITHGDAWAPNFLIRYSKDNQPEAVKMIDFQLTRYTSLSNDLLFFLFACVDMDLVINKWDFLFIEYHKHLGNVLEKYGSKRDLISLEMLKKDIRDSMAFGIGMSIEAIVMSLLDDSEISDLDSIQGEEAVPLESVWIVHPFKEQYKRKRLASVFQLAVDKDLI